MQIYHETLVFERVFKAGPDRLFQAYTDPRAREVWSAPTSETVVVIDDTQVATGGRETARCGSAGHLNWRMNIAYHTVEHPRHITFTEELWEGDRILTVALITFHFEGIGQGETHLTLTDQVTSFVGQGGVSGHRDGYEKALANLAASILQV